MPQAVPISLPFEEAIAFFRKKGYAISPDSWRDVWQEAHARAFTVARVTSMDILEDIRGEVQKALDAGTSLQDFKNTLTDKLTIKGWFAPEGEDAIIELPDGTTRKRIAPWRLETIYRTNLQSAYSTGRYRQMEEVKSRRPYLQYKAIMDSRTRDAHAAMNNKVYRFDDPIWDQWYPPNGFNCRCYVKSLMESDLKERGLSVAAGMPADLPDEGWQYNVGKTGLDTWKPELSAYTPTARTLITKSLKLAKLYLKSIWNKL
jgi:phage putative head morphogenesis protein, SPP1 gp7 family